MNAIVILKEEHRLMDAVLDALERVLEDARLRDELNGEAAADLVSFLEAFADGSHQDKEEHALFPRLLERAPAPARARVESLLSVHGRERALLDELRGHLEGAVYGDAWSRDVFVRAGREYLALQRRHAAEEDENLFPLAEGWLHPADDEGIVAAYQEIEASRAARGAPDPRRLAERILVPPRGRAARRGARPLVARAC